MPEILKRKSPTASKPPVELLPTPPASVEVAAPDMQPIADAINQMTAQLSATMQMMLELSARIAAQEPQAPVVNVAAADVKMPARASTRGWQIAIIREEEHNEIVGLEMRPVRDN